MELNNLKLKDYPLYEKVIADLVNGIIDKDVMQVALALGKDKSQAEAFYVKLMLTGERQTEIETIEYVNKSDLKSPC